MSPAERKRRRERLYWTLKLWGPVWLDRLLTLAAVGMATWAVFGVQGQAATIQRERAKATLDACRDQNDRHDGTVLRLQEIIADLPPGHERRRAVRNLGGTIALIDALAPRQDCAALVSERVTSP